MLKNAKELILQNIIIVLVKQKHQKEIIRANLKKANRMAKEQLFGQVVINM
jgi:hypothetical protein